MYMPSEFVLTGGVAAGQSLCAGVVCKLENRTLTVGSCGLHHDISGVLNRHNYAGRQLQLLPSLPEVDDVNPVIAPLINIAFHLEVAILGSQVALSGQQQLDIL